MNRIAPRPVTWIVILLLIAAWTPSISRVALGEPRSRASASPSTPSASPSAAPAPTTTVTRPPSSHSVEGGLGSAVGALSKVQTLLEFYYMWTGQYPDALEEMVSQYNQGVRQSEPLVTLPTDPATGKKFLYTPSPDHLKYVLRAPEPAAYGVPALEIRQVDWGWMASLAAEKKKQRLTLRCAQYMQLLAEVCDQYNKANRNKYPDTLEQLIPKYLQKQPTCPLNSKPFLYKHDERGFEIACPDPKAHGLEIFRFSSTEGLKKYP